MAWLCEVGSTDRVLLHSGLQIIILIIHEGVIVPTALYAAEVWGMRSAERRKMNVLEMKCLKRWVGELEYKGS